MFVEDDIENSSMVMEDVNKKASDNVSEKKDLDRETNDDCFDKSLNKGTERKTQGLKNNEEINISDPETQPSLDLGSKQLKLIHSSVDSDISKHDTQMVVKFGNENSVMVMEDVNKITSDNVS